MTGSPNNFLPPLPPGLDEVDLLAWVEGDPLPRNREVAVARLLSEHPGLARRLEAMRLDREALRDMPAEERAPAGLLDGVHAALQPLAERQMLLGLQDGEAVEDRPPLSLVVPPRRTILDILVRERTGRRIAMAAGLLLVVGGGTYFAAMMFSGSGGPGTVGELAAGDRPEVAGQAMEEEAAAALFAEAPEADVPEPIIAEAPREEGEMLARADEEEPVQVLAAAPVEEGEDAPQALASQAEAASASISLEEAVALAQENRLVVRVQMGADVWRPERIAERLRGVGTTGWRLSGEAPNAMAMALIRPVTDGAREGVIRPGETLATGEFHGVPSGVFVGPPEPREAIDVPRQRSAVYLVQSRMDRASLESLRTALRGVSAEVIFEEAELPLSAEPVEPSMAPSAVLWWGQPPAAWTWWTTVPVVVEPAR